MNKHLSIFLILLSILFLTAQTLFPAVKPTATHVSIVQVEGAITPVVFRIISNAIDKAKENGSQCLIIQLDTPGGLEKSMRSIVQKMLNSEIPVVVYVSPTGARAASAGVFITLAAHIAVMAPATNIGAAHPVAIGTEKADKEMIKKITNDAAAFIKSIAVEKGRNVEWAENAVRKSISATEKEALKLGVIDLISESVSDLLQKIDGRKVKIGNTTKILSAKNAEIKRIEVGFRDRFLNTISDPNIAYILMMLGILGLFFELANPGVILPGVIGGICLILAFFAFQSLPINYAGLLLILFGLILLIAEIKVISHGVLTIGGVISLILGSIMLIEAPEPDLRVSWTVILPVIATTVAFFMFAIGAGIRAQMKKPTTGIDGLIDGTGEARTDINPYGQVFINGEIWKALSEAGEIKKGEKVKVIKIDSLTLIVERVSNQKKED